MQRAFQSLADLVFRGSNHDPLKVFLDAGPEDSPAVFWLGTRFPSLLAGLILRGPLSIPGEARADEMLERVNLQHLHVLLRDWAGPPSRTGGAEGVEAPIYDGHEHTVCSAMIDSTTLAEFVADRERISLPTRVVHHMKTVAEGAAYWVRVVDIDRTKMYEHDRAFVVAEIDRDQGLVAVFTHPAVRSIELYFNDELLDLDEEFRVEHSTLPGVLSGFRPLDLNNRTVWRGKRPRDLRLAVDLPYYMTIGSPGEVFTAKVKLELD